MPLNIKGFIKTFSFVIVLTALSLTSGFSLANLIVIIFLVVFSVILLLENISTNKTWKQTISYIKKYDFTYLAFGFSLLAIGPQVMNQFNIIIGLLILLAGITLVSLYIGKLVGKGSAMILESNFFIGICTGIFLFAFGTAWLYINLVKSNGIVLNAFYSDSLQPFIILSVGLITVVKGVKSRAYYIEENKTLKKTNK